MMQIKRVIAPAVTLLFVLSLFGCSHSNPAQSSALSAANQNPANQPATTRAPDQDASSNPPVQNPSPGEGAPAAPSSTAVSTPAREPLTIPAGTPIIVRLQQSLSSASAAPGERFDAVIDQPVAVGDKVVLPVGTPVTGHVTVVRRSGRLHHPGKLGLALDTVNIGQQQIPLATASVVAHGHSHKKRNLAWIGGAGGGGALIGALAAGGKGALIGGPIGLAAGTTTAFITGKKDVGFGVERLLTFRLRNDVSVGS